ncbi:MAG: hypothetical protein ACD_26C00034G0037 [uncultured bacterium]|nr:MAG: hypothetical protein ACD_26C00034G0037 [uncultured bacterium]
MPRSVKVYWIFLFLIFIIYVIFGYFYFKNTYANGDEVHFLVATHSIVYDHDVWLENNYDQKVNLTFNPGAVDKIVAKGLDGHLYPVHGIGYSLLLAPFYALGNRLGTIIFSALLLSAIFILTCMFSNKITKNVKFSLILSLMMFLSHPLFNFSALNFTDAVGALVFILAIYNLLYTKKHYLLVTLILSFLPWIHIRYFLVALILYLYSVFKTSKRQKKLMLVFPLSIVCYFLFLKSTFGSYNPYTPYMIFGDTAFYGHFFWNLLSLFIDRQFGLLVYSPLFLYIVPGTYFWYIKNKKSFFTVLFIAVAYLIPIVIIDVRQGYAPPARLFITLLPLFIPSLVFFFMEMKNVVYKIIATGFFLWSVLNMTIALLLPPNHGFVYGDGVAPSLLYLSMHIGINIQELFPSFYHDMEITSIHYILIILIFIFWGFIFFDYSRNQRISENK